MVDLSVVIPAYREAENLRLVLPQLQSSLAGLGVSHEILVIDSKTPLDDTQEVCTANQVQCFARRENDYYGAAVREGIRRSSGKYVVFMDADGSHPSEFISQLYTYAGQFDIVIASRYTQGGSTENPVGLVILSRVLNLAYVLILGMRCSDVSNSFRLYDGAFLRLLTLRCNHFDIVEEILVSAAMQRPTLSIKEIPFAFQKRLLGESKRDHLVFYASLIKTLLRFAWLRLRVGFKLRA